MTAHFQRGLALFDLERYPEAAKEFSQALAEDPEFAWAHANLAAARFNQGDIAGAEESVAEAVSQAPELAHSYCVISHIKQARNDFPAAKEAILEAIRLEPSADYFYRLAEICDWREDRDRVLEATSSALELDPTHVPSILLRGRKLVELSRLEEANRLFSSALRENPSYAEAHHALGRLQLSTGDASSALELLKEARRLDPLNVNDKLALAEAYGLNFPAFRTFNRYVVRWHQWPFYWKWAVSTILTLLLCVATEFSNAEVYRHSGQTFFGSAWWFFCVLLLNYLVLPYTLTKLARSTALVVAKQDLDLGWLNLILQPVNIFWICLLHGLATLMAGALAVMPEIFAIVVAVSTCYPLVLGIAQSNPRRVFGLIRTHSLFAILRFLLLVPLSFLGVLGVVLVAFDDGLAGYVLLLIFFSCTYFSEKLGGRANRVRLTLPK